MRLAHTAVLGSSCSRDALSEEAPGRTFKPLVEDHANSAQPSWDLKPAGLVPESTAFPTPACSLRLGWGVNSRLWVDTVTLGSSAQEFAWSPETQFLPGTDDYG